MLPFSIPCSNEDLEATADYTEIIRERVEQIRQQKEEVNK